MDAINALNRFPMLMLLEDGTELTVRPLERDDKIRLARFFQRVSEEDRFYLKENVLFNIRVCNYD